MASTGGLTVLAIGIGLVAASVGVWLAAARRQLAGPVVVGCVLLAGATATALVTFGVVGTVLADLFVIGLSRCRLLGGYHCSRRLSLSDGGLRSHGLRRLCRYRLALRSRHGFVGSCSLDRCGGRYRCWLWLYWRRCSIKYGGRCCSRSRRR